MMKHLGRVSVLFVFLLISMPAFAQPTNSFAKASWTSKVEKIEPNIYEVRVIATIAKDWHIYSINHKGDGTGSDYVPLPKYEKNNDVKLLGKPTEKGKLIKHHEEILDIDMLFYENHMEIVQRVKVFKNTVLKGSLEFTTCQESCMAPAVYKFQFKFDDVPEIANENVNDTAKVTTDSPAVAAATPTSGDTSVLKTTPTPNAVHQDENDLSKKSLWEIFAIGFGAGLVAFIMPCIYALLPITVSFFTKRSKDRKTGLRNAIVYSLSIIFIFTAIGALISVLFTEKTMYEVSTSIWFNLFVFITFIIFGISFLGAFEITLPSSWSNKLDSKANSNSIGGIFFMAAVLVVVSFSCTSAFISSLIVYIVKSQNSLGGLVGFFGFGFAIALPFALFAFFPGMLNNVAKSGGWLNNVKVTMGFLELAMALKFLSNVDLEYHWHLLDFEVYLSIWIVIFAILGFYLLGKIKLSHDDELPKNMWGQPYVGTVRLVSAITVLAFTVYMIPGLWGAPLTGISGWLPERKTLDFNLHDNLMAVRANTTSEDTTNRVLPIKYAGALKSELPGIDAFFDYHEALAAAKKTGKPVLLDFTGHSCVNCRKMERAVLSKPEVLKQLREHFVVASLYCDDKTKLIAGDEYISAHDKSKVNNIGEKNLDIEVARYNAPAQPLYVFVDAEGNVIKNAGGFDPDMSKFLATIEAVKEAHKKASGK